MGRTSTVYIDLTRLQRLDEKASTVIRLMMACNDIALANLCLGRFIESDSGSRSEIQHGAKMYFVKMQCGHLNEAIKIIDEIKNDSYLYERVSHCYEHAKDAYSKLEECLKGGKDEKKFLKYVELIRHKVAFHYNRQNCSKLVLKALRDRASSPDSARSKITAGDHISLHRFHLADDILDTIVCRYIWEIPRNVNLLQEANKISDYGSDLCLSVLVFGGDYINRFIREHAVI